MLRKLEPHSQSSDLEAHPSKTYSLFAAPYKALPFVFFVLFVLCFELYPHSPIHTHYLRDPDHYMRLNQVVNWLQGQSWYDLSVPRMSPGAHTVVHWSRLIDIPIVAIALPLTHWLSVNDAALAASFVVPFLWLGALLLLSPAMACPFVGCARKNLDILSLLFAPLMLL
ncbi:MAG: hypothetical protein PHW76_10315, partial [Alphaproteobacteria bacterium]|nr:hypothetical protein [Alphaproteobacteria bacterium]